MRKHLILPVMLALVALPCQAGDIYKWQEKGKTIYGEYPPAGVDAVQLSKSAAVRMNNSARPSAQELLKQSNETADKKAADSQVVADAASYKKARSENCAIAKRNLAMFQTGGRHRFKLPDGTVSYLDEAETQRRTEEAQGQINDFCD